MEIVRPLRDCWRMLVAGTWGTQGKDVGRESQQDSGIGKSGAQSTSHLSSCLIQ